MAGTADFRIGSPELLDAASLYGAVARAADYLLVIVPKYHVPGFGIECTQMTRCSVRVQDRACLFAKRSFPDAFDAVQNL